MKPQHQRQFLIATIYIYIYAPVCVYSEMIEIWNEVRI